jgi:hypothetical protein
MFVRAVYATGDPALLDTAVRSLNSEGRDLLEERPGYRGAGIFVDRELGKLLAVSWWETEAARHNSDEIMRERREALLEPFAGTVSVANYEAAVFHQIEHPRQGGGLRAARLEFDPRDADLVVDAFRATVVPRAESLPGLCRTSLLLDRERGRAVAVASWRTSTWSASRSSRSCTPTCASTEPRGRAGPVIRPCRRWRGRGRCAGPR